MLVVPQGGRDFPGILHTPAKFSQRGALDFLVPTETERQFERLGRPPREVQEGQETGALSILVGLPLKFDPSPHQLLTVVYAAVG